jgi:hypothetical protein
LILTQLADLERLAGGGEQMTAELLALAAAGIIPPRLAMALVRDGKRTVADLANLSPGELMTIPKVGPKGRAIIDRLVAAAKP